MLKQNCSRITDYMENIATGHKLRMIDRMVRRIMQTGIIQPDELKQVTHGQHAIDFKNIALFIQFKLCSQPSAMHRIHPQAYLQPDNRGKLSLLQFRLDHLHQIISIFFMFLCIGIPGNPENFTGDYFHAGKQHIQVMHHQLFQRNKGIPLTDSDETW